MILSRVVIRQIVAGKRTELRFPKSRPCPVQAAHTYSMKRDHDDDRELRFEVIALTERRRQFIALVKLASDVPRFLAKQDGQPQPEQYASSAHGSIDELEAVPSLDQRRMSVEGREADRQRDLKAAGNALAACQAVRAAFNALEPELKRKCGREIWQINGRVDALERKLKRQAAA